MKRILIFVFLASALSVKMHLEDETNTSRDLPKCRGFEATGPDGPYATCDGQKLEDCEGTWTKAPGGRSMQCGVSGKNCLGTAECQRAVAPPFRKVFNSCGISGPFGPSQEACNKAYGNEDVWVPTTDTTRRGYQVFTVPEKGDYMILAAGAAGGQVGQGIPGKGAVVSGKFALEKDDKLVMVVGQKGEDGDKCNDGGGGGGGGTFVALLHNEGTDQLRDAVPKPLMHKKVTPLLVAGGGGGNDDDAFWGCKQISAEGMDGGLDKTGGSPPSIRGGGCDSHGAGMGEARNGGHTKGFFNGAYAAQLSGWRESGGFGGGAASCNSGGGGGGFNGGRTNEEHLSNPNGKCRKKETWDPSACTSGGTSFMSSKGTNFNAHGALVTCNGFIVVESCADDKCMPWKVPKATFGAGCTWGKE